MATEKRMARKGANMLTEEEKKKELEARLDMLKRFDVQQFQSLMLSKTGEKPHYQDAVVTMHKARCHLHEIGLFPSSIGIVSANWLEENGH